MNYEIEDIGAITGRIVELGRTHRKNTGKWLFWRKDISLV